MGAIRMGIDGYPRCDKEQTLAFTTHHLRFTVRAMTDVRLAEQPGKEVRGALTTAIWRRFCVNPEAPTCAGCALVRQCPVAVLVAPLRDEDQKGSDQGVRPYVIQPPLEQQGYVAAGSLFEFGMSLFGAAADLFPFVVRGALDLQQDGLGQRGEYGKRGRVRVERIVAVSPLSGARMGLYEAGKPLVQMPGLPIGAGEVQAYAAQLPTDRVTLLLHTPMRLMDDGQLVRRLTLRPLIQRLMRRLDDLHRSYGGGALELDFRRLLAQAAAVRVVADETRWVDVVSYSGRARRSTPIGGLVGRVAFVGDVADLRVLLVWGMLVHVGKNAVKGDGWYTLAVEPEEVR